MTTETKTERSHAETNADGHAESILELYRAYKALEDGDIEGPVTADGCEFENANDIREHVLEGVLALEVRGPWHLPGDGGDKPDEFKILLTWGGPALQIRGDLTEFGEPTGDIRFQIQDWGTPWTDYLPASARSEDDWDEALEWYASCFYFGE